MRKILLALAEAFWGSFIVFVILIIVLALFYHSHAMSL